MGNKPVIHKGRLPHLQVDPWVPLVHEPWFRMEVSRDLEKGPFHQCCGLQDVGYSRGVGFWFETVLGTQVSGENQDYGLVRNRFMGTVSDE